MEDSFRKKIRKDLDQELMALGFKRKKYIYYYTKNRDSSLVIHIGGRHSYEKGIVILSVSVGVAIHSVNKLYIKLTECQDNPYVSVYIPIVRKNLGYIMPQNSYKEWYFEENSYAEQSFAELVEAIKTYAFQYYEDRSDIRKMEYYVKETNEVITNMARDEYYPIILYLSDKKDDAVQYIKYVLNNKQYVGLEEGYYKKFAEKFLQLDKLYKPVATDVLGCGRFACLTEGNELEHR